MSTTQQRRIEADRARPRITELWWALRSLKSVMRFMQTGAHPDDEISGMLAALAFRDGINLSYACSTRGEGGQNDIGTEAGAALGALRTREMEKACDILRMRMYWHSETPDDPVTDFGFSKSGDETLGRWGEDRTLARFVEIVRTEKPDLICPTFLDVPGQHGHHRAITQSTHDVMKAAADPAFPSNLPPWQVKKMYLPAWSGAGQAYDDDLPPPPPTLTINGQGGDPISGWSWERIGQQSRAYHRTQGMGRWIASDQTRDWPLHLAESHLPGPDSTLTAGLPANVGDLAILPGADGMSDALDEAQRAIDATIAAFPDFDRVASSAIHALTAIRSARAGCPDALKQDVAHRLDAKEVQLGHVIRLALGIDVCCRTAETFLAPGQSTTLTLEATKGTANELDVSFDLPNGWSARDAQLVLNENATPTDPYRDIYDPADAQAPACIVEITHAGERVSIRLPFETPPVVLPSVRAQIAPDAALINLATETRSCESRIGNLYPVDAAPCLDLPEGWQSKVAADVVSLKAPKDVTAGRYDIPVKLNGKPAMSVQRISYDHIAPTALSQPAVLRVLALEADIPDVKVGYVGAGNDRVNLWLASLGADVTDLSDADLASDEALAQVDTIIIGILAMRFRDGLAGLMPRLHAWTKAGGTLLTLYHRPWDNWKPDTTPPYRLEIGQPSLRWRVTNENAEVRHLTDHPILMTPNRIGPDDWADWVKERGLYFAKSWDPAYTPLIEMADSGEDAHQGSLLVADVGKGRHIHTSLILHHQMENLVPGAFRLMANFIAKRV